MGLLLCCYGVSSIDSESRFSSLSIKGVSVWFSRLCQQLLIIEAFASNRKRKYEQRVVVHRSGQLDLYNRP